MNQFHINTLPDIHIESNRYTQRRLEDHLKPIDALLIKWAPEARHDGAPRWPASTALARIIEQGAGASQSGKGQILSAPADVEFCDWAVSQLRELKRLVIYAEYVQLVGWSADRKSRHLGVSRATWDRSLNNAREIVFTLCRTYGRMLHMEIV